MAREDSAQVEKKERHRSPNYPAVGLQEAVHRVGLLYEEDGKAGAPADIAAKHIGFSTAHGQAMSVLAALKRFGLIIENSGRYVPSQTAIEILKLPDSDQRRRNAIQEAALSPALYRELYDTHRETGLPSAEVLEAELVTYRAFNPKAVSGFVRDFLGTLEYAGIDIKGQPQANSPLLNSENGTSEEVTNNFGRSTSLPSNGSDFNFNIFAKPPFKRTYPLDISIPRSLKAELSIIGEFRKEDFERLKTQIGRLLDNLQVAFGD